MLSFEMHFKNSRNCNDSHTVVVLRFFLLYFSVTTHNHHDHLCKMITNNRLLLPAEETGVREHIPVRRNAANPGFQGRTHKSILSQNSFTFSWILNPSILAVFCSYFKKEVLSNAALNIWQCPVFKKQFLQLQSVMALTWYLISSLLWNSEQDHRKYRRATFVTLLQNEWMKSNPGWDVWWDDGTHLSCHILISYFWLTAQSDEAYFLSS